MNLHRTHTRQTAAAKAGFSTSTGARLDAAPRMPSQTHTPRGRRRPGPLAAFWESEILPMLQATPGLRPNTVLRDQNAPVVATDDCEDPHDPVDNDGKARSQAEVLVARHPPSFYVIRNEVTTSSVRGKLRVND